MINKRPRLSIHGILLLDKPTGMTSNTALQRVKWLFQAKKAGHTGSLDPIATGMLPLCFGNATKLSHYLLTADKTYNVTAKLGEETTTGDIEGDVVATHPVPQLTSEQINEVISRFIGDIDQLTPMYSALKHQGRPLYELARQGITIERQSRRISIYSIVLHQIVGNEMTLQVHCSKGTYIRTLVEDIGRVLGCGAHVKALRRTDVSAYTQNVMYTLPALEAILASAGHDGLLATLLPIETAVSILPIVKLSVSAAFYLRMGQAVRVQHAMTDSSFFQLLSEEGQFLGIGEALPDGRIKPHRLLAV